MHACMGLAPLARQDLAGRGMEVQLHEKVLDAVRFVFLACFGHGLFWSDKRTG